MTKVTIRKGTKVTRCGIVSTRTADSEVTIKRSEVYKKDKRYVTVFWKSNGYLASARINKDKLNQQ